MQTPARFHHTLYSLLAACLMLALVCVQSAQQHIHIYDHTGDSQHAAAHDHAAHPILTPDHHAHGDQIIEVSLAQQALVKQLDAAQPLLALFSILLVICLLRLARRVNWPLAPPPAVVGLRCLLPPLRGPPALHSDY